MREGSTGTDKLVVRGLRKSYGDVVALRATDLNVRHGEFLTLLGPSGSGKTTLLMAVAGLIQPDDGEVSIDGEVSTYTPSHRRDIGMVFQNYALFPHLSIYENVAFPLRMRRMPAAEIAAKVGNALELVRLPHVAARLPRELSGGQQQRIALARAMVYEPSIVLMDEPLGALDKKLRDQMQLEIKQLHERLGLTVIYVTHDQEEAMVMSDRICLMNDGGIEGIGTPGELYMRPTSVFMADFLGESVIFEATVRGIEAGYVAVEGPGSCRLSGQGSGFAAGERASIVVRPEALRLLGPGERADNILEGTLERAIMVAGVTRLYVRVDDALTLTAKVLTGAAKLPGLGSRLTLGWPADQTVVLRPIGVGRP